MTKVTQLEFSVKVPVSLPKDFPHDISCKLHTRQMK